MIDFSTITNSAVREALQAWQASDSKTFLSYFTTNPNMMDDGNARDFNSFVKQAWYRKNISIDKVDNAGRDIYGRFQAGSWGRLTYSLNSTRTPTENSIVWT